MNNKTIRLDISESVLIAIGIIMLVGLLSMVIYVNISNTQSCRMSAIEHNYNTEEIQALCGGY